MRRNPLKAKIGAGKAVFGTFVSLPEPSLVEAIACTGYDFLIIDMEHSPIDFCALPHLLAAADGCGVAPLVRLGACEVNSILQVLDAGSFGVVIPHVRSKDVALSVVNSCQYPPLGNRGVSGASRAAAYGQADYSEHMQQSNTEIMKVALIEEPEAVDIIEEIADVDGLDVVCPGPGDLSAKLGLAGQLQHPSVQKMVRKIAKEVLPLFGFYNDLAEE